MIRVLLVWGWLSALAAVGPGQELQEQIAGQLERAGDNRVQLETALREVPAGQRDSMEFLVAWMQESDLRELTAERLLENVRLAHEVRGRLPWQKHIPDQIFLNHVLPHACLDEPRDPWRAEFLEKFWPLVANSTSAAEAAQILNEKIFAIVQVKYSTQRQRANQSPAESMAQGLASCSGLSILLVDACRAVGVPARVAGIPAWPNKPGNHTWVEIWDGTWHFTGAAEYDPAGLDRAWFTGDASLADPEQPRHSIYATSYAGTGLHFPLPWNRRNRSIHAENVTARYRKDQAAAAGAVQESETVRTFFRALDADGRKRVAVPVEVRLETPAEGAVAEAMQGRTRDEGKDRNDWLEFSLKPGTGYIVTVGEEATGRQEFRFQTGAAGEQRVEWRTLPAVAKLPATSPAGPLDREATLSFAREWFAADPAARKELAAGPVGQSWPGDSEELRQLLWQALVESGRLDSLRDDLAANRISSGEHVSPWVIKDVGERPANGWPLVIAMHGGGNAPQELNDSQWEHMQIYYRDHPEVSGYRYLALRAPNNTWNGFYDNYVYPLIVDLIVQQVAWNDVDPDRIYLIGYSHGGYGAFAIGPKMPDRFAAIHASASAGTDGETSPVGLHTTRFTWMVGGRDTAFGRRERCEKFDEAIRALRGERVDRYPAEFFLKEKSGHGGLPDRDWLVRMLPWQRQNMPLELDWELTDPVVRHHYWLAVEEPAKGQRVSARFRDRNVVEVRTTGRNQVTLWLDERNVDPGRPLQVDFNGQTQEVELKPSLAALCDSLWDRRDRNLAGTIRIELGAIAPATPESSSR